MSLVQSPEAPQTVTDEQKEFNQLWILIMLKEQLFALPAKNGHSMIIMPEVTRVPGIPRCARGVIRFRENVIPLIDLRKCLGMVTILQEDGDLSELINDRIEDHRNWITELENSVTQKRNFSGAIDPNFCKMGRWLNTVDTSDLTLRTQFQRIRGAHANLHSVASVVLSDLENGRTEEALAHVQRTRSISLTEIIKLFDELKALYKSTRREIAIILEHDGNLVAFAVDRVVAVEQLQQESMQELSLLKHGESDLVSSIGKRRKDESLVQLLDIATIIENADKLG